MRTLMAIVVAVVVAIVVWVAASLFLNLLNLATGETGWFTRLLTETVTPGIGAFVGLHAADKVAKHFSLDGLYYGFCATVITGTLVIAVYMQSVATRAEWRAFDWLVMIVTPLGAVAGAFAARSALQARRAGARSAKGHAN